MPPVLRPKNQNPNSKTHGPIDFQDLAPCAPRQLLVCSNRISILSQLENSPLKSMPHAPCSRPSDRRITAVEGGMIECVLTNREW